MTNRLSGCAPTTNEPQDRNDPIDEKRAVLHEENHPSFDYESFEIVIPTDSIRLLLLGGLFSRLLSRFGGWSRSARSAGSVARNGGSRSGRSRSGSRGAATFAATSDDRERQHQEHTAQNQILHLICLLNRSRAGRPKSLRESNPAAPTTTEKIRLADRTVQH